MSLVVDIGSYSTKYGVAGTETPELIRSCLYKPRFASSLFASLGSYQQQQLAQDTKETVLAKTEYSCMYSMRPIVQDNGFLSNTEDIGKILDYVFAQNKQAIHKLTLIVPPLTTQDQQRQIQEYCFEQLDVRELLLSTGGAFALYTTGRVEGLSINIGDTTSFVQPILNGQASSIEYGCVSRLAGRAVTQQLLREVYTVSNSFSCAKESFGSESADIELCYALKHAVGDTAIQSNIVAGETEEVNYALPDGSVLKLPKQRVQAAFEIMFRPVQAGQAHYREQPGIISLVRQTINNQIPLELHSRLYQNVVVSGGTSLCPGLVERIATEMAQLSNKAAVFKPAQRAIAQYQGASVCAMLPGFTGFYIKREHQ